jgi:hypothetical protein
MEVIGAATPFYRELYNEEDGESYYNYTEYHLFSLISRVKRDKRCVRYSDEIEVIDIKSKIVLDGNNEVVFLVAKNNKGEVQISWLSSVIERCYENMFDYVAIINFNQAEDLGYPSYWLQGIAPFINIETLHNNIKNINDSEIRYPVEYIEGCFYMKMFDSNNIQNIGESIFPYKQLNSGDRAYNHDDSYGDFSDFEQRYKDIRTVLLRLMIEMYQEGVVAVNEENVIENWKLSRYLDSDGLYYPNYNIIELTKHMTFQDIINNQAEHNKNSWMYNTIIISLDQRLHNNFLKTRIKNTGLYNILSYDEWIQSHSIKENYKQQRFSI